MHLLVNSWSDCPQIVRFDQNLTRMTNTLLGDQYTFLITPLLVLKVRNIADQSCRENWNTFYVQYLLFLFWKMCRLWDIVEKYCIAGQATDDNMTHAHCMRDTWSCAHTHTLRICYIYYLSTATMVARTRLNVSLYVHCLPCFNLGAMWGVVGQRHARVALLPGKRPGTHYTGGWVGPRNGVDVFGKSRCHRESHPGSFRP